MNTKKEYTTKEVITRFWPYYKKYRGLEILDLICAALTTVCDLILPVILRYITNTGLSEGAALTMKTVGKLGLLYLILRIIDMLSQ